jgi:L-2-hydroxyglutarate oxidase LhgO
VATNEAQIAYLHGLLAKGAANGVTDLALLSGEQARALEPELACVAAVQSPSTGIVDSHGLMLALLGDLEHAGGLLALNSGIHHAHPSADWSLGAMVLVANDGTELAATTVVNAAGLYAPALARQFQGLDAPPCARRFLCQGQLLHAVGPFALRAADLPGARGGRPGRAPHH